MSTPKVELNLEGALEAVDEGGTEGEKLLIACCKDKVEEEKCVVAQYRTTVEQKNIFVEHLKSCKENYVDIEWVIDIADESNGWFYGTAYHYDGKTNMLHVMVPDKLNPTFDGEVLLDYRTVHLIECVDGKTDALFNKIVRDSVVKVKWDVEWFEDVDDGTTGSWTLSSARYYIRIANQLLVEDKDNGQATRGFVILTADLNLRLLFCHKNKGAEDFYRLINDGILLSSPEAAEAAKAALASPVSSPNGAGSKSASKSASKGKHLGDGSNATIAADVIAPLKRLADMSRGLRECLSDLLDDRVRHRTDNMDVAKMISAFALDGDLDEGLKLLLYVDNVKAAAAKRENKNNEDDGGDKADATDKMEASADDAWYFAQKVEKGLVKIISGNNSAGAGSSASAAEEVEQLRRQLKKLKKEVEEKDALLELKK